MFFLPFGLRRNPVCRDSSNAGDSVVDIRQQSPVYAVELFAVVWQRVGEVTEALQFCFLKIFHYLLLLLCISSGSRQRSDIRSLQRLSRFPRLAYDVLPIIIVIC